LNNEQAAEEQAIVVVIGHYGQGGWGVWAGKVGGKWGEGFVRRKRAKPISVTIRTRTN